MDGFGMPKMEKSFVEIVREMVEQGHSLATIVETLSALGLGKEDAKKLVGIMDKKSLPRVRRTIDYFVKKKVISLQEARELKFSRRGLSEKRRSARKWSSVGEGVLDLLEESFPDKMPTFLQRWQRLQETRAEERELRKEIVAFLLELDDGSLSYGAKNKLKKAVELLG